MEFGAFGTRCNSISQACLILTALRTCEDRLEPRTSHAIKTHARRVEAVGELRPRPVEVDPLRAAPHEAVHDGTRVERQVLRHVPDRLQELLVPASGL